MIPDTFTRGNSKFKKEKVTDMIFLYYVWVLFCFKNLYIMSILNENRKRKINVSKVSN